MKALSIVGTRPEAIKMAPVIKRMAEFPAIDQVIVATSQHREMLGQALGIFGIAPTHDLDLMQANQTLGGFTGRCFTALDPILEREKPDVVIAQGDTATVLVASILSFYRRTPFFHVEAGLRTFDFSQPFPEEFNRVVASTVAELHFAPTASARANLLREGVAEERILVTGNTVIDALLETAGRVAGADSGADGRRTILVTAHRRENFGEPIRRICEAVRRLLETHEDIAVVWPVHPNPNVADVITGAFAEHPRVRLSAPFDYEQFVAHLKSAFLVLTDSGGVQEEAPALGKPVLVLREDTERPEAVEHGCAALVGTDVERIVSRATRLLADPAAYDAMAIGYSPYGDGHAAERIVDAILARST
jgi:UDP-N-acetylglucosamine 2-epimerase (non-hydrolysing)